MNKLVKISSTTWIVISLVIFVSLAFVLFLLTYKVETVIHTKVHVKGSTSSIYVNSDIAYRIKDKDIISLRINSKIHTAVIKEIIYDKKLDLYKIELTGLNIDLLPNSILDATIITGKKAIGAFLIGSV